MNTKNRYGLILLGMIIALVGATFMITRGTGATLASGVNPSRAVTTQNPLMEDYFAKDLQLEYGQSATIASQNLPAFEYFAEDLQLEYGPSAGSVVTTYNPSQEAQYFAQDLYAEYGLEDQNK